MRSRARVVRDGYLMGPNLHPGDLLPSDTGVQSLGECSLRSRIEVLDDAQRRERMSQEDDSMLLPAPDGDRLVARKNHDKPLIFEFNFPTR